VDVPSDCCSASSFKILREPVACRSRDLETSVIATAPARQSGVWQSGSKADLRPKGSWQFLTHAHPDHAGGLVHGRPLPGLRPRTWRSLPAWPVSDRQVMPLQKSIAIAGIRFEALPVEHSIRAPAVGYRVSANLFRNRRRALRGVDLYVGDGASITRPIIRRRGRAVIGNSSIRAQLDWCKSERVAIACFIAAAQAVRRLV
jgi:hypothetical protein